MRKFFALTLMTLSLSTMAFAQDAEPAAGSLKANMKHAGTIFKAMAATVNDASKNAENAKNAADMAEFFKAAQQQTPDHIGDLPKEQQAQAVKDFQDMIQKVIDHCVELQQAFQANDNAKAAAIYNEMKQLKHDGHERFDP